MSNYRVKTTSVKTASLNAQSTTASVPCDRDAVIEECWISSRDGITAHAANNSTLVILNGATKLFERKFITAPAETIAALTNEKLTALADTSVSKSTCLQIRYDYNGSGLAQDLDIVFVFRPSRS